MTHDIVSILVRALILQLIAVLSELALHNKMKSASFFMLSIWMQVFRLTLLKSFSVSVGAIKYTSSHVVTNFIATLQNGPIVTFMDLFMLITLIWLLIDIRNYKHIKE